VLCLRLGVLLAHRAVRLARRRGVDRVELTAVLADELERVGICTNSSPAYRG
jgi:hypothetical protein